MKIVLAGLLCAFGATAQQAEPPKTAPIERTFEQGRRRLTPGDYYVAAHEFLTLFNSSATEVKLVEGSHQALEAKIIPAEKIKAAEARLP